MTPVFPISDREHKKWENSSVSWPNNPFTEENLLKRKERPLVYSSEESGFSSIPANGNDTTGNKEADSPISTLTPWKDAKHFQRYARDYIVPIKQQAKPDEALNCLEEQVILCSKITYKRKSKDNIASK